MDYKKLKQRLFNIAAYVSITLESLLLLNTGAFHIANVSNKATKPDKKTVVFVNGHTNNVPKFLGDIGSYVAYFFMYAPVTLKENLKENNVEWRINTSKDETLERLIKNDYNNLVLIGHGSDGLYAVRDGSIVSFELKDLKIKGRLIKYTCGDKNLTPFEDIILEDPQKGFRYKGHVKGYKILYDSWKKLFN